MQSNIKTRVCDYSIMTEMDKPVTALSFNFLTPFYDFFLDLFGFGEKQRIKIVNLLKLKPYERLLDLGCGTGSLLVVAKRKHSTVDMIGVDVDEKILDIAQRKIQKENLSVRLVKASADKLPFPDSSFDVVVSTLVFHHLPTDVKKEALKEVHRVLKKNGRFLLADFGKLGLLKIFYHLEVLFRIPEAKTAEDNVEGRIPEYLRAANFKFTEIALRYLGIQYLLAKKAGAD